MPNFKARLLEKMACSGMEDENQKEERSQIDTFGKRRIISEQGVIYHGNPQSLSYMHGNLQLTKRPSYEN